MKTLTSTHHSSSAQRSRPSLAVAIRAAALGILLCAAFGAAQDASAQTEKETHRTRLISHYQATEPFGKAADFLSSQNADGGWEDINYADTRLHGWAPRAHLDRMRQMAVSHSKAPSDSMRDGYIKAFDYWFALNPTSTSGWRNDIEGPGKMAPGLLLMEAHLSPEQVNNGIAFCLRGTTTTDYIFNRKSATGQNRVWLASIHAVVSSLNTPFPLSSLRRPYHAFAKVLNFSPNTEYGAIVGNGPEGSVMQDGMREDFAFAQHGRQLYNGGYGGSFVADLVTWIKVGSGLSFGICAESVDRYSGLLLDGTQWMIRRGSIDWACVGRNISREGWEHPTIFMNALDRLVEADLPRKAEFQAFKDHITGDNDGALVGNKHFWLGDYHAHRRVGYSVGIKMVSKRTLAHEGGNGENNQGKYLSSGATKITTHGRDYEGIYPVWDWALIPGTTTQYNDPAPGPVGWGNNPGLTDFVGGVSDGHYGVAAYQQEWEGVSALKAWFCFDEEVVCLGSGIGSTAPRTIKTSINQSLSLTTALVEYDAGSGTSIGTGTKTLTNPKWVHQDGVGYVFPTNATVTSKIGERSGSYRAIQTAGSTAVVSKDVFSLWFDHGVAPSNQAYHYILIPGKNVAEVRNYSNALPVSLLSNTTKIQAVRQNTIGVAGIVFYEPGSVEIRAGLTVASDGKAIVLVDESVSPAKVSLAHPENSVGTRTITLSGAIDSVLVFTLPTGPYTGSSLTMAVGDNANAGLAIVAP